MEPFVDTNMTFLFHSMKFLIPFFFKGGQQSQPLQIHSTFSRSGGFIISMTSPKRFITALVVNISTSEPGDRREDTLHVNEKY